MVALRQVHQLTGHAVDVALGQLFAQLAAAVENLDCATAHHVKEAFFRRKPSATPQVADLDVFGELVEQFLAKVVERTALFEKLADLDQFDFHLMFLRLL